jgi:hypothetical protein
LHDITEVSARFESRNANPGHERWATRHVGSSSSINGSSGIKDDTTLLDYVLLLTVRGVLNHKEPMHPTRDVIAISVFSPIPAAFLSWPKRVFLGFIDDDDYHEEREKLRRSGRSST